MVFPIGTGDDLESEVRSVGIYLNPGNTGFLESIRSEIYVDKTELMEELSEAYGDVLNGREVRLAPALRKIYAKTGKPFIFLMNNTVFCLKNLYHCFSLHSLKNCTQIPPCPIIIISTHPFVKQMREKNLSEPIKKALPAMKKQFSTNPLLIFHGFLTVPTNCFPS